MPTILLIEEDDDARPILRYNLRHEGYDVLVAVDESSALDWVGAGRVSADLILDNLFGKTTEEALAAAPTLRSARGGTSTPRSRPSRTSGSSGVKLRPSAGARSRRKVWTSSVSTRTARSPCGSCSRASASALSTT